MICRSACAHAKYDKNMRTTKALARWSDYLLMQLTVRWQQRPLQGLLRWLWAPSLGNYAFIMCGPAKIRISLCMYQWSAIRAIAVYTRLKQTMLSTEKRLVAPIIHNRRPVRSISVDQIHSKLVFLMTRPKFKACTTRSRIKTTWKTNIFSLFLRIYASTQDSDLPLQTQSL